MHKADGHIEKGAEFPGHGIGFPDIALVQRVVVESNAIDYGDQEEGPVGATFGLRDVAAVVYREKNVRGAGEVWKDFAEGPWVWGLEDHEGHAWAEEDNVGGFVLREEFMF